MSGANRGEKLEIASKAYLSKQSEKALLSACIYYVKDFCPKEYQNFETVLSIIRLEQLNENVAVAQESNLEKLFTGKAVLKNGRIYCPEK